MVAESDTGIDSAADIPPLPQKSKLPLIAVLLGAGGIAAGAYLGLRAPAPPPTECAPGQPCAAGATQVVSLDTFVVNLNEEADLRYLKCTLALEVRNPEAAASLAKHEVRLRNAIMLHLSAITLAETRGTKPKQELQQRLLAVINETLGAPLVHAALLTEFVVQ